mmetsp:Transcript_22902/g.81753  ORF Transcript_22902/g.81753 Transcript_22902/m.81753 type:complete len:267 (+) Transcript_22902:1716-2516(+)
MRLVHLRLRGVVLHIRARNLGPRPDDVVLRLHDPCLHHLLPRHRRNWILRLLLVRPDHLRIDQGRLGIPRRAKRRPPAERWKNEEPGSGDIRAYYITIVPQRAGSLTLGSSSPPLTLSRRTRSSTARAKASFAFLSTSFRSISCVFMARSMSQPPFAATSIWDWTVFESTVVPRLAGSSYASSGSDSAATRPAPEREPSSFAEHCKAYVSSRRPLRTFETTWPSTSAETNFKASPDRASLQSAGCESKTLRNSPRANSRRSRSSQW